MIHLRPSGSYRWSNCAASPTFEARVPAEPDSDAAREGTCAAALADACLKTNQDTTAYLGVTHSNGWLITADMCQHVQKYVDLIRSRGGLSTTEQHVTLCPFISGTLDSSTALTSIGHFYVTDLKYGMRIVEVFELPQLIIYGAAEYLRLAALGYRIETVTLEIYQPRAFHPDGILRPWTLTIAELGEYATQLIEAGERCQVPNPVATPGKHCRDCRAKNSCVAFIHQQYANYERIEDVRQHHMSAAELASELDFVDHAFAQFKQRSESLRAEADARMATGEYIPNWARIEHFGNRRFKVDPAIVQVLTGKPAMTTPTAVTPAEMERRGADVDVVAALSEKTPLGFKLDRISDNYVRKAFAPK